MAEFGLFTPKLIRLGTLTFTAGCSHPQASSGYSLFESKITKKREGKKNADNDAVL